MSKLKVGVIGIGAIGRVVLEKMTKHKDFEVVAAWDLNPDLCKDIETTFPDIEVTSDAEGIIADKRIEIIYIATPPASHEAYVRLANEAGKMVYCEKPFGVNLETSGLVAAEVKLAGRPSVVNFNHGNAASTTFLEDEMANGNMGKVAGVDIFIHLTTWPRAFQAHATWLASHSQGGFTREMLSHWIYLTTRLLGEPELLHASVHYPPGSTLSEERVLAELSCDGIPVVINAFTGGAGPIGTEYTIWGNNKSYRVSGGRVSSSDGGPWTPELDHIKDIDAEDHKRNLDGAAARFRGKDSKMATIAEGYAVQELVETILAS